MSRWFLASISADWESQERCRQKDDGHYDDFQMAIGRRYLAKGL